MEIAPVKKLRHKEWRRLAKRERRRRARQRAARIRDEDAERLQSVLERSADYLTWLAVQRTEEENRAAEEIEEHARREQKWLEDEVKAQEDWRQLQIRKAKAREEQLAQEARIRQEFEEKQEALRSKQEEAKRREEQEKKQLEDVERQIDEYINEGASTPPLFRMVTNSQPSKELCPFFTKTGACRYGDSCSRNHQRVGLSKVILVPSFYSHFSLEKNSAEYDTDVALEFESSEMRQHFREFYHDVVPELERFGRIKTLKYCRNAEIHLRGNLYVEYFTEREAARAMRGLKGRWYAGRQLNCEFANLKSWRNAVCGMQRCPKGRACNFLHIFRNPRDKYDIQSPPRSRSRRANGEEQYVEASERTEEGSNSSRRSHRRSREDSTRNWRWSESPEAMTESQSVSRSENSENRENRRSRNSEKNKRRRKHERKARRSEEKKHPERGDNSWDTPVRAERVSTPIQTDSENMVKIPEKRLEQPADSHRHGRKMDSERRKRSSTKKLTEVTNHDKKKPRISSSKSRRSKEKQSSRRTRSRKSSLPTRSKWDTTVLACSNSDSDVDDRERVHREGLRVSEDLEAASRRLRRSLSKDVAAEPSSSTDESEAVNDVSDQERPGTDLI